MAIGWIAVTLLVLMVVAVWGSKIASEAEGLRVFEIAVAVFTTFAGGGLLFWRSWNLNRQVEQTQEQMEFSAVRFEREQEVKRQEQQEQQFVRAIEHLAHDSAHVRFGAVLVLRSIMQRENEHSRDILEVMYLLVRSCPKRSSLNGGLGEEISEIESRAPYLRISLEMLLGTPHERGVTPLRQGFVFEELSIRGLNLQNAAVSDVTMLGCGFLSSDFTAATLTNVYFKHSYLADDEPFECELYRCQFSRAVFVGSMFEGVRARFCMFDNADLRGGMFPGCHFRNCIFDGADLEGVEFFNAVFQSCTFVGTNLSGTSFIGAVGLETCDGLTFAQLSKATNVPAKVLDSFGTQ